MFRIRMPYAAAAVGVVAVSAIAAMTLSGQTREQSLSEVCAHADWPYVPAYCLEGASDRAVRVVALDRLPLAGVDRFEVAFQ
jgi:hypothetical protein